MKAAHSKLEVVLRAPQAALFNYLADPRNRPQWQSSITQLSMLTEGPPAVGTRWRETARGFGTFEMAITVHEPPSAWAEHGRSGRGGIDLRLDLRRGPRDDLTHVTLTLRLELSGLFGLVQPLAPRLLRPLMTADLRRAARLARGA